MKLRNDKLKLSITENLAILFHSSTHLSLLGKTKDPQMRQCYTENKAAL